MKVNPRLTVGWQMGLSLLRLFIVFWSVLWSVNAWLQCAMKMPLAAVAHSTWGSRAPKVSR